MLAEKEKKLQDKKNFSAPLPIARHIFVLIMTANVNPVFKSLWKYVLNKKENVV